MLPPPRDFCTGYRFEKVTYSKGTDNEWFVSVLSLKKEAICGHERGELSWWSEPYPPPGTFSHAKCIRASDAGTFLNDPRLFEFAVKAFKSKAHEPHVFPLKLLHY